MGRGETPPPNLHNSHPLLRCGVKFPAEVSQGPDEASLPWTMQPCRTPPPTKVVVLAHVCYSLLDQVFSAVRLIFKHLVELLITVLMLAE